jgi:hypothetical protein
LFTYYINKFKNKNTHLIQILKLIIYSILLDLLITLFIYIIFQFHFIKMFKLLMLLEAGMFICIGALSLFKRKLIYEKGMLTINKFDLRILVVGLLLFFLIIIIDAIASIF